MKLTSAIEATGPRTRTACLPGEDMKKIAFIAMFWIVAFILPCTGLMAADPIPPELRRRTSFSDGMRFGPPPSHPPRLPAKFPNCPAKTPEKEMERRRKLINDARADFDSGVASARAPVGHEEMESADRRSRWRSDVRPPR